MTTLSPALKPPRSPMIVYSAPSSCDLKAWQAVPSSVRTPRKQTIPAGSSLGLFAIDYLRLCVGQTCCEKSPLDRDRSHNHTGLFCRVHFARSRLTLNW